MKFRRLPPLHTLETFESAARTLSFKQTAADLHLTPSAVSHQIRALEEYLGFPLFRRLNRGLELTKSGRAWLGVVDDSLARLRDGSARLQSRYRRPSLKITVGPYIASEVLMPALPQFRERHPEIDLSLETDLRVRDLAHEDVDVALRFGTGDWPGAAAIRLLGVSATPVCAPRLAPAQPTIESLAALPRIQSTPLPRSWNQWAQLAGFRLAPAVNELWFDSYLALMQAAESGLGVALGLRPVVDSWLRSGRLVAPWPLSAELPQAYYLLHRPADARRPEIEAFRRWLTELLADQAVAGG